MADTPKVQKFSDVLARVRTYQEKMASDASKKAGHEVPETDPAEKGTESIPVDPESSKKKQNMPEDNTNESNEGKKLEDKDTNPASTGKDKVKTTDGTSKDEAATGGDPTIALSKIASRAKNIVDKLKKSAANANEDNIAGKPNGVTADGKAKKAEVVNENTKEKNKEDVNAMKSKAATALATDIQPNPEFLFKLASTILETEGGLEAVEPILRKAAGIEAAQEIITKAASAYDMYVEEGYQQHMMHKAAAEQQSHFFNGLNEMFKQASASERESIIKIANMHEAELNKITHPILKQAYMQGSMDAASMQDSGGGDPQDPMAGGGQPSIPGGEGGEPSPEQIVELLQAMVQSGEIDEQTASAIVQELIQATQGGAGGAGGAGGDPTGGAGGDPTGGAGGPGAPGGDPTGGAAGGDPSGGAAGGDPTKQASNKNGIDSLYKSLIVTK